MSLLGKQVFANPTTPLWGGGGGVGPNPTFNSITFIAQGPPFVSTGIETTELDGLGSAVSVVDVSGSLAPMVASSFYAEPPVGFGARVAYKNDRIDFENASQVAYSLARVNSGSNGWDLSNISTINGSNYPPGGGGSYPRDASFNSITVNPTGGPNPVGFGLGGTAAIGIRQLDEDGNPGADYITFNPSSSQMDLSNVSSINGRPIPLTLTAFNQAFSSPPIASFPGTTMVAQSITAPADGKLFVQAVGNFQSTITTGTSVAVSIDVNGSTISNSIVYASCGNLILEVAPSTMAQFPVVGGTVYDVSLVAFSSTSSGDWNGIAGQVFLSFTPS